MISQQLHEVKYAYNEKLKEDIDAEHHVDDDGAPWVVHRGAAPSICTLMQKLNEVKAACENLSGSYRCTIRQRWH